LPGFAAADSAGDPAGFDKWIKRANIDELRFQTFGQVRDTTFKPIAQITDERYSVYWIKT